jgi:NTP pyrophosphatase (non-canonical NTP hydrolase)
VSGSPGFEELTLRLRAFAEARDWGRFHTPKDLAMSVSIEAAELLEVFQWKDAAEIDALVASEAGRAALADELADVLIYLLRLADVVGIDLPAAALAKIERNEERFPAG